MQQMAPGACLRGNKWRGSAVPGLAAEQGSDMMPISVLATAVLFARAAQLS